jgi:hypothetical protein
MMPPHFGTVNEFVYNLHGYGRAANVAFTEGKHGVYALAVYNFSILFCVEI